jgi:hypothetical protein
MVSLMLSTVESSGSGEAFAATSFTARMNGGEKQLARQTTDANRKGDTLLNLALVEHAIQLSSISRRLHHGTSFKPALQGRGLQSCTDRR